ERVGPRLKVRGGGGGEWRDRLRDVGRYHKAIGGNLEVAEKGLRNVNENTVSEGGRIRRASKMVNRMFSGLAEECKMYRKAEVITSGMRVKSEEENDRLARALGGVRDQLEEVTEKIAEKSDTDTRPLVRMRSALKVIKGENKDLEVELGVLRSMVLRLRGGGGTGGEGEGGGEGDDDEI
ncbi:hypothetical protein TrRE_jg1107, partial [Triparma retinervis]